jgi:hypothetical protein
VQQALLRVLVRAKQAALSWERPEVKLGVVCGLAYGLLLIYVATIKVVGLVFGLIGLSPANPLLERSTRPPGWVTVPEGNLVVAFLNKADRTNLLQADKIKNPPRYDDLAGQEILSSLPTGWCVLTVLLCTVVALGFVLLLISHFHH